MTYSRPSTSTVDAFKRVSSPNAPDLIGSQRSTVTANGRYLDNRNPGQIIQNGQARAAEVTNFIDSLTKVAKPLIDDALLKQANRQVGELLATQDPVQLIRGGTEEQRALVRKLSPQAQDILTDKAAQGGVRLYQESLSAERTKRAPILQSITATPEEKARAESEAASAALEFSGLNKLPPQYLAAYGGELAQTNAALKGLDYKETLKNQTKDDRAKYVNGIRSTLPKFTELRIQAAKTGDAKAAENFVVGLRSALEQSFKRDAGVFTYQDQAEMFGEAIGTELAVLKANNDWDGASALLGTLEVLAQVGLKTDTGLDFFGQKLNNGTTLEYLIAGEAKEIERGLKQFQSEQARESVKDLIPRALNGEDVMTELVTRVADADFETQMSLAGSLSQLRSIGNQPSNQQLLREAELQYQLRGMKPEAAMNLLRGELTAGRVKVSQFGDLVGRIGKDDPKIALIDGQRGSLQGEITEAGLSIARAAGITDAEGQRDYLRSFNNDVTKAVEKRVEQLEAEGKPVDETVVRGLFRNEVEAARTSRLKNNAEAERSRIESGPRARVTNEVKTFQQNVQASGGEVTVMSFDKGVRVEFQQQFPNRPMTVDNLLRFQADRLKAVPPDKDGKPAFERPNDVLKDIIKRSQAGSAPRGVSGLGGYGPLGPVLRRVSTNQAQAAAPAAKPPAEGGAKPAAAAVKPQEKPKQSNVLQAGAQIVGAGLELVANVIAPPASAATNPETGKPAVAMENQAAVETLMKLWKGQQRMSASTPPLPQLSAQTPVQLVGTAINNVMNPFFVAIGIAEGTRTAAGGYTKAYYGHRDPGSGAWNKGTVSGQNAPNAEAVDRQWMARLTSVSTRVAPVLRNLGLAPGTQGYNRLMFNVLDLTVQAPAAAQDFIRMIPRVVKQGASIEAIAKARADSFINPATGRLEAGGFGNSYSRLLADQRSRSGAFDYKRRI